MRTPIVNNREALEIGQLPAVGKEPGPTLILLPGLNLVDSKMLADMRKNKNFDSKFKTAILPSLAPEQNPERVGKTILEVAGKEVDDLAPLAKLNLQACKLLIAETLDSRLLDSWAMEETRADVMRVINEQLVKIGANLSTASASR